MFSIYIKVTTYHLNAIAMNQLKVVPHFQIPVCYTCQIFYIVCYDFFLKIYYLWEFSLHGLAFSIASTHCLQESITLSNKLKTIKSVNSYTWSPYHNL